MKCRSIADLLLKIWTTESSQDYTARRTALVTKMFIEQFTADADFEQLSNLSMILNDLIAKSMEFSMNLIANETVRKILLTGIVSDVSPLLQQSASLLIPLIGAWKNHQADVRNQPHHVPD